MNATRTTKCRTAPCGRPGSVDPGGHPVVVILVRSLWMETTTDVIVIGGGIIGCSIAYYLRKAGVDVIVLDQGEIGTQASSAAAGLLAPLGSLSGPGPY